jgi:hypothetical protein
MSNARYKDLADCLSIRYGVSAMVASPTTVLWAANHLIEVGTLEVAAAKSQLKALNAQRHKLGVIPAYADFGTRLF